MQHMYTTSTLIGVLHIYAVHRSMYTTLRIRKRIASCTTMPYPTRGNVYISTSPH